GLINVAHQITVPKLPLSGYVDYSKFKVYLLDSGLLGAMLNLSSDIILQPTGLFSEYNGAFIENFVAMELIASGISNLFYWTSKSDAEVDFVIQSGNEIYPIEVKSGVSRNLKSIRSYAQKFKPEYIFRTSARNFIKDKDFINIPLYAAFLLAKVDDLVRGSK
ncbi:MAG: ATPase, partial [Bacteroidetes bacterium]